MRNDSSNVYGDNPVASTSEIPIVGFESLEERLMLSAGPAYEVWGGFTDYRTGQPDDWQIYNDINQTDYTFLGAADTSDVFSGTYDFYVIASRVALGVDAVLGSDSSPAASATINVGRDPQNIDADDGLYALVGQADAPGTFRGSLVVENPGTWTGLDVVITPIEAQVLAVFVGREIDNWDAGFDYVYDVEISGIGLLNIVVTTPWDDTLLASDYLPGDWAGEYVEFYDAPIDMWFEAGSDGPDEYFLFEWNSLDATQWAAVDATTVSIDVLHEGGLWNGTSLASAVPMPTATPVINSPLEGETDVSLTPTITWDPWFTEALPPEVTQDVWAAFENWGTGQVSYDSYVGTTETSWTSPGPLAPNTDYDAAVWFENLRYYHDPSGVLMVEISGIYRDVDVTTGDAPVENTYEVWGGFTPLDWWGYRDIHLQDYISLGTASDSAVFNGTYDYYVISAISPVGVDSVQGSDASFVDWADLFHEGGSLNSGFLTGPTDGLYAVIGTEVDFDDVYSGFITIQNPGTWNSITVNTLPITPQVLQVELDRWADYEFSGALSSEGYGYEIEFTGVGLTDAMITTPWGEVPDITDILPADWNGEYFEYHDAVGNFWLEAYARGQGMTFGLEWYNLSAAEWASLETGQSVIDVTHQAGAWTQLVDFSAAPMPGEIPTLLSPVEGETGVGLSPIIQWAAPTTSPTEVWVAIDDPAIDDEVFDGPIWDQTQTSWAVPGVLENDKDYMAWVEFANIDWSTLDGAHYFTYSSNNIYSNFTTLALPVVDVAMDAPASPAIEVEVDSVVMALFPLLDLGTVPAGNADVAYYISTDANVDTNDTPLALTNPDGFYSANSYFLAPSSPGTYYVAALADPNDILGESDETNNWSTVLTLTVAVPIPPEPIVDVAMGTPAEPVIDTEIGSAVFAPFELLDFSTSPVSWVDVAYYASTDPNVDQNDTLLTLIHPDEMYSPNSYFIAPSQPGTYYVAAMADPNDDIAEDDETNNWSPTVTLNAIDPNAIEQYAFADYFPMEDGTMRAYHRMVQKAGSRAINNTVRTIVTDQQGQYEFRRVIDGKHSSSAYYQLGASGLVLHNQLSPASGADVIVEFESGLVFCPAQFIVGDTYVQDVAWSGVKGTTELWSGNYHMETTVVGFEQITVPSGTYTAIRLSYSVFSTKQGRGVDAISVDQYDVWMVEGIGVVKQAGTWSETEGNRQRTWNFSYDMLQEPVEFAVGSIDSPDLVASIAGNLPQTIVPGQRLRVSVTIQNLGGASAVGEIALEIYVSHDQLLAEGDFFIKRVEGVSINIAPGGAKTINVDIVAPGYVTPGAYYLLGLVDADDAIEEIFESNNVALGDSTSEWTNRFGNVSGRGGVRLTMDDGFGTPMTFSLRGNGYGEVTRGQDGHLDVTYYGTDTRTSATITTPRGHEGVIDDIIVAAEFTEDGQIGGSLRNLTASTTDLLGDIDAGDGIIGQIKMDDVADDHNIYIGSVESSRASVSFSFDSVGDLSIYSDTRIRSLICTEWLDTNETSDEIYAPSIGTLKVTGRRANSRRGIEAVAGHFGADLMLGVPQQSFESIGLEPIAIVNRLANASIAGDLYDATWSIFGSMGNLAVKGIVENATVTTQGNMGKLSFGAVIFSDFLAGVATSGRHASSADDFTSLARISAVSIRGIRLPDVEEDPFFFEDSNFSAASIGRVSLLNLWAASEGGKFGFWALDKQFGGSIASIRYKDTVSGNAFNWTPSDGQLDILDFTARLLDQIID